MEYGANEKVTAAYEYGVNRESAEINDRQYYYEYDGKGSVTSVTNTWGVAVTTYSYDAYGNAVQKGLNIPNPYGYNAEYTDDATDLQYLRARYYNPSTGTFITADSYLGKLTIPLSMNRYIYGHNNPVNGSDQVVTVGLKMLGTQPRNGLKKKLLSPLRVPQSGLAKKLTNMLFSRSKSCIIK